MIYFYRFEKSNGDKVQERFDDLMTATRFCIKHFEENPTVKNPIVTDEIGKAKFAPRTIK